MADYYCQAVICLGETTEEEHAWVEAVLAYNDWIFEQNFPATKESEEKKVLPEGGVEFIDASDTSPCLNPSRWDDQTFLDHEEYASVDHAMELMQAFLKKFRPPGTALSFEWANTCSKMRADGFGGGACVVTADDMEFVNTGSWIAETTKRLTAEKENADGPRADWPGEKDDA